jgi:hypothetical protein
MARVGTECDWPGFPGYMPSTTVPSGSCNLSRVKPTGLKVKDPCVIIFLAWGGNHFIQVIENSTDPLKMPSFPINLIMGYSLKNPDEACFEFEFSNSPRIEYTESEYYSSIVEYEQYKSYKRYTV